MLFASAGVFASLTPPALPRPPEWTWAFTTTVVANLRAIDSASSGVVATSPGGIGMPYLRKISFAWYSWIFTRSPISFSSRDYFSSTFALDRCPAFAQLGDDRAATSTTNKIGCRGYLRPHAALTE